GIAGNTEAKTFRFSSSDENGTHGVASKLTRSPAIQGPNHNTLEDSFAIHASGDADMQGSARDSACWLSSLSAIATERMVWHSHLRASVLLRGSLAVSCSLRQ